MWLLGLAKRYPKIAIFALNVAALAIFWPFGPPKPPKPWHPNPRSCVESLRSLSRAMAMYEGDHDGRLPDRDRWMDSIQPYVKKQDDFYCPEVVDIPGAYGYAMNSRLSRKVVSTTEERARSPLLYDSLNMGRDASDPFTSLPSPARHGSISNVAYVDGHIEGVPK